MSVLLLGQINISDKVNLLFVIYQNVSFSNLSPFDLSIQDNILNDTQDDNLNMEF